MTDDSTVEEERRLLAGWRQRQPEAGKQLYLRHAPAITRFLERRLADKGAAPDLVQRTFVKLQETTAEVKYSVLGFIYGVAFNELRRWFRDQAKERRHESLLPLAPDDSPVMLEDRDSDDPETALAGRQERRLVGKALRRLDLDDQVILEFTYWEDMPRPMLAEVLDLPEGTVAGRIAAARRRLAAKIAELAGSLELFESTSKTFSTWLGELQAHLPEMQARDAARRKKKREKADSDA